LKYDISLSVFIWISFSIYLTFQKKDAQSQGVNRTAINVYTQTFLSPVRKWTLWSVISTRPFWVTWSVLSAQNTWFHQ
jgi:hypothetical protein